MDNVAELESAIAACDRFIENCKSPVPVQNIPGELDRLIYVSQWRGLEEKALPLVSEMREDYKKRLATLRASTDGDRSDGD